MLQIGYLIAVGGRLGRQAGRLSGKSVAPN